MISRLLCRFSALGKLTASRRSMWLEQVVKLACDSVLEHGVIELPCPHAACRFLPCGQSSEKVRVTAWAPNSKSLSGKDFFSRHAEKARDPAPFWSSKHPQVCQRRLSELIVMPKSRPVLCAWKTDRKSSPRVARTIAKGALRPFAWAWSRRTRNAEPDWPHAYRRLKDLAGEPQHPLLRPPAGRQVCFQQDLAIDMSWLATIDDRLDDPRAQP